MIKLITPSKEFENQYKEMIKEWQDFGGPFAPCIIEYDCGNRVEELNYDAVLNVVEDYGKGKLFDYDVNNFERSDFYFIFNDDELIGMGELRHNLKENGEKSIGHINCGVRPNSRRKGYATRAIECLIEKLKEDNVREVVVCCYADNEVASKFLKKLNFEFSNRDFSSVNGKQVLRYTKILK